MSLFEWGRQKKENDSRSTGERFRFKLNQRVKMGFSLNGERVTCMSSVQDVFEHSVRVYLPASGGTPLEVQPGTAVDVTLFDSSGMYDFSTTVSGINAVGVAYLELVKPGKVSRYQKRKSVRTRAALRVFYLIAAASRALLGPSDPENGHATTRDISENGVCLVLPHELAVGVVMELRIQLPAVRVIKATGEVVRVAKDQFSDKYFVGVIMQQMSDEDRGLIQEFVDKNEHKK